MTTTGHKNHTESASALQWTFGKNSHKKNHIVKLTHCSSIKSIQLSRYIHEDNAIYSCINGEGNVTIG